MAVRRILAAALAAPLLLLAACGDDGDSIADPPISSAPSSPATPQRETPEHFIRRWFSVGTRMQNTGDPDRYLAMQRDCRGCTAVANKVTSAYGHGGFYKTRGVRDLRVSSNEQAPAGRRLVVLVDLYPTTFKTSASAAPQHFHGGPATFQVSIASAEPTWLVTDFVQVAS
jgi:hypothetical protein